MKAFHGDNANKVAILKQLRAHAKADEIVKGYYWEKGKGCAVGCTIHSDDHTEYETRFGIPQMLAYLEDAIFEGLPNDEAKKWPVAFMSAIEPGADLSRVGWQFLHWLLTDESINPGVTHPLVKDAVKKCADVLVPLTKGKAVSTLAARAAAAAARAVMEVASEEEVVAVARTAWRAAGAVVVAAPAGAWAGFWIRLGNCTTAAAPAGSWAGWAAVQATKAVASASGWNKMADKLLQLLRMATPSSDASVHVQGS